MQPFLCSNMLIEEIWNLIYGGVNIPLNQSFIIAVITALLANITEHTGFHPNTQDFKKAAKISLNKTVKIVLICLR